MAPRTPNKRSVTFIEPESEDTDYEDPMNTSKSQSTHSYSTRRSNRIEEELVANSQRAASMRPSKETINRRKKKKPQKHAWLHEVRKLQNRTDNFVPKLPFSRLVREILQIQGRYNDMKITREALLALQESAELYITYFFEDTNRLALHAGRVTIQPKDMHLIYLLRTNWGI